MPLTRSSRSLIRRWWPTWLLAVVIVATAPTAGLVRDLLLERLGGRFITALSALFIVAILVILALVVRRLRTAASGIHWPPSPWRWLALGVAFTLLAIQFFAWGSGSAQVDVVERIHVLQYGALAFLAYRALFTKFDGGHDLRLPVGVLVTVLLVGTLDEWLQWLSPARVGDYRDVFLNLWSGVLGLLIGLAVRPPGSWSWRVSWARGSSILGLAALTLVVFGGYFDCAHLGYRIDDPGIGSFRSYFSAEALRAAAADRRNRWASDPPTKIEPFSVEDYFLTEGVRHVQQRNTAYAEGNFDEAWSENRILEDWFDPVLDVRSFRSGTVHRWPPAQRAEVEAKAVESSRYVSPVMKGRIVTRPDRWIFWSLVVGGAAALTILGPFARRTRYRTETRSEISLPKT